MWPIVVSNNAYQKIFTFIIFQLLTAKLYSKSGYFWFLGQVKDQNVQLKTNYNHQELILGIHFTSNMLWSNWPLSPNNVFPDLTQNRVNGCQNICDLRFFFTHIFKKSWIL